MNKNYIPTIDVSKILDNKFNSIASKKIINKINKACVEVGFFQIVGHGIKLSNINKICTIGEKFFETSFKNKLKLAPRKWNKKNKNFYRGYFPNDVNGKEGLDLGDLRVTKNYSEKLNNQYIEYLNIKKSLSKKSTEELSKYFDNIFNLSETIFKAIIKFGPFV